MTLQVPNPPASLPVVIPPEPMLRERSAIMRTAAMLLGAAVIVVLVLYGMTRPDVPHQIAAAPGETAQAAPAGESDGRGQNQPPAQPAPTSGQGRSAEPPMPQPGQGKVERSDSATTRAQPGDQPKQTPR